MLKNKLKRWLAAAVSAVMICGMAGLLPVGTMRLTEPIVAEAYNWDLVDDYPSKYKAAALDALVDEWKYYNRECTSFVAWRLNSRNGIAFHNWYGGVNFGNASTWGSAARNIGITVDMNPAPGSVFWQTSGQYGHVAWVNTVNDNGTVRIEEYNWSRDGAYHTRDVAISSASGYIHLADINPNPTPPTPPTPVGKEMTAGAGQTIRDGDYYIYSGLGQNIFLDASGTEADAADSTNVNIWSTEIFPVPDVDTWTVTYQKDGFYRIKQKTSNSYIDCGGTANERGANIHMWHNSVGINSEWSIYYKAAGYWIQGRANSWFIDVAGAATENGTNVQNWEENDNGAQAWCFIPANPAAVVKDGIYRIHTAVNQESVLDAAGNIGAYKDGTNVQIWDETSDDVFQFTHDANGYYYITEVSSGLAVGIDLAGSNYLTNGLNITLQPKADKRSQKWAILKNTDGTYTIISQLNGYALDLAASVDVKPDNGKNVTQFPNHNKANQRWALESVTLQSIKVAQAPDKLSYFIDEKLNPAGIIVNLMYSGNYSFKIANGLTYQYDFSTTGEKTVKVSYKINGKTLTDSFKVTVSDIDFKGSGTEADPYLIESKSDLEKLRDLVNSEDYAPAFRACYYLQTADIDLDNEKWTPIGKAWLNGEQSAALRFLGHYDGGQHWIHGLNVNETTKFVGLFGCVASGSVENLAVDGNVSGAVYSVGGIVGEIQDGTVSDCCFIGNVTGSVAVGGVAGYIWQKGTVKNSYHIGTVKADDAHSAGGVVGRIQSNEVQSAVCTVENCYHVGKMDPAQSLANTIVGYIDRAATDVGQKIQLLNCYGLSGDGALCAGDNPDTNTAQAVKESVLKLMAPTLGDSFVKNSDSKYLDGYPVFPWQTRLAGDVNADGSFNIADAVLIHKWLVTIPDVKLANWEAGDMNGDGKLDVRDLSLMKQALLNP